MIVRDIARALELLLAGEALGYPTETFYGLGGLALEAGSLDRIEHFKPRDFDAKPYPMILGQPEQLRQVAAEPTALIARWIEAFWPGPLTLVVPALCGLDPRICGPSGGVAVRVSPHPLAAQLAALAGPIVSTSANPSGQPPPTEAAQAARYFDGLPVLDGGTCPGGAPSTIVDLTQAEPSVLRWGAIGPDELEPWLK